MSEQRLPLASVVWICATTEAVPLGPAAPCRRGLEKAFGGVVFHGHSGLGDSFRGVGEDGYLLASDEETYDS
eukprot:7442189-Heterocapsa_arctica.AAC.1